jgi:hypothetical protein
MKGFIMTTITNAVSPSAPISFMALLAKMNPHFKFFAERVRRRKGVEVEDVMQELTGFALVNYISLVRRGKEVFYSPILKYAILRYKEGRRFAGSSTIDVTSERTQTMGRSEVCCFSQIIDEGKDTMDFMEDRRTNVAGSAQFKLDFEEWLRRQTPRDRKIILDLMVGETTGDVAKKYGVSAGLISQYRKRYGNNWNAYIVDKRQMA